MTRRRQRRRAQWDVGRIREAIAGPGADTRTWTATARVDDDDDAIRWDENLGWIVDVTIQGGPLDQTGPIACRVATPYVEADGGRFDPPTRGALVAVAIIGGNANNTVWITGFGSSPDEKPPTAVNGEDIDEDFAGANHIFVTEHSVQQQVGEKWRTSATDRATLEAPELRLASEDADQDFVRGNDQKDAFGDFLTAFSVWTALVQAQCALNTPPITIETTAIDQAVAQLRQGLTNALSSKIKGE